MNRKDNEANQIKRVSSKKETVCPNCNESPRLRIHIFSSIKLCLVLAVPDNLIG